MFETGASFAGTDDDVVVTNSVVDVLGSTDVVVASPVVDVEPLSPSHDIGPNCAIGTL